MISRRRPPPATRAHAWQATSLGAVAEFYVPGPDGRSCKYQADEHGIIRNVAQIHIEGLKRAGCTAIG